VLGYLAAWTLFSLAATVAQEALHSAALLSSMGISTSNILGGTILAGTGVFQFMPLKNACLRHCRSPLGFILTEWREGTWGALRMGLRHGLYCVGCCWLLMSLLFVAGVMNLWWVAAIAGFVVLEKTASTRLRISHVTGVLLMGWGGWMLTRALAGF
jgi:predicted metal-binding membrane protein